MTDKTSKLDQDSLEFINSIIDRKMNFLELMMDPRRDIYQECGFPKSITQELLYGLYKRNPIAKKIITVRPNHSWKVTPEIFEISDAEETTEFEKAISELHSQMRSSDIPSENQEETGWYRDELGSPLWELFKEVDIKCGVGLLGFSVILIGFDDGKPLSEPLEKGKAKRVLYCDVYDEKDIDIQEYYTDPTKKNYLQPMMYSLKNTSANNERTVKAHHTRVIHVANSVMSSAVEGVSRLENSFNLIHGSDKLIGAAPEGYWKMAFTKMLLEALPGITKSDVDIPSLKSDIKNWENGLQGVMGVFGLKGNPISPKVTDPGPFIDMLVDLVAVGEDIPKRILQGSERGELASSQDKQEWNEVIRERQLRFISPCIIAKFLNRLIWAGVLPEPKQGFKIEWPNMNELDLKEAAEVMSLRAEAFAKFVAGGVGDSLMSEMDFLVREANYTLEEAAAIIEAFDSSEMDDEDTEEDDAEDNDTEDNPADGGEA